MRGRSVGDTGNLASGFSYGLVSTASQGHTLSQSLQSLAMPQNDIQLPGLHSAPIALASEVLGLRDLYVGKAPPGF